MEHRELLFQVALSRTDGIGSVTGLALLKVFGSASAIFQASSGDLARVEGLAAHQAKAILGKEGIGKAEAILAVCDKKQFSITGFGSDDYPKLLSEIPDAPLVLYYLGDVSGLNNRSVAFVGTRKATAYGKQATYQLIEALAPHGVNILSGLAAGIDTYAHKAALEAGLPTWALMASGLDILYPSQNKPLAAEIVKTGGLMTEFPPGTKPDAYNFPARNRILAGLSAVTVVIESAEKGGSLITAQLANDYNRDVLAVPGRLGDNASYGCNQLIASGEASLLMNANQILDSLGIAGTTSAKTIQEKKPLPRLADPAQITLVDILVKATDLHIDELVLRSGLEGGTVAYHLLNLEFAGIVVGLPGKRFTLSPEYC